MINSTHLNKHGLSVSLYRQLFPEAEIASEEFKKKMSVLNLGKIVSAEVGEKIRQKKLGSKVSDEVKKNTSLRSLRLWQDPVFQQKMKDRDARHSKFMKELWKDPEYATKVIRSTSEGVTRKWKDPEYVKKQNLAQNKKPSNPEIKLGEILESIFPEKYSYTGDFSFSIDGCNPDFVNFDNCKIIEHLGCYWHHCSKCGYRDAILPNKKKLEDVRSREYIKLDIYAKHGYDVLFIWEHELEDVEALVEKVKEFDLGLHLGIKQL